MSLLSSLLYFTNEDLRKFTKAEYANIYLSRYTKQHHIVRLKRGHYVTQKKLDDLQKSQQFDMYKKYLATNVLMTPSYLSCEYGLFTNHIVPENVYHFISVTTKKTNKIENSLGLFTYQHLHSKLFRWYEIIENWELLYFQAYPEKALLDWLWLKKDLVMSETYFAELRINMQHIDMKRLATFVKKYNKKKITECFLFLQRLEWSKK